MKFKFISAAVFLTVCFSQGVSAQDTHDSSIDDRNVQSDGVSSDRYEPRRAQDVGGPFVEPFLGYGSGTLQLNYPAPVSNSDEDIKGGQIGARLGFHLYDVFFLALDPRYAQFEYESAALGGTGVAKGYNVGATIGAQTPLMGLRVWATSIFSGDLDPDAIRDVDVKFTGFNGYRVGAAIYVAFVSVNVEYEEAGYNNTEIQSAGNFTGGQLDNVDATQKNVLVSLSFPITL